MAYVGPHRNRIFIRFRINGTQFKTTINSTPTEANKRAARAIAKKMEYRLLAGEPWEIIKAELRDEEPPEKRGSLGYYMQHVFDTRPLKRPTLKNYENTYDRVWGVFDEREITNLRRSELQRRLAEFKYTPKGQSNALSVLRLAFEAARGDGLEALRAGLPTDNWATGSQPKPLKNPYTQAERDELLTQLKAQNNTAWRFFYLAFFSGMRTEELLAIQPRKHFAKPLLRIRQVRTANQLEQRTKTDEFRDVYLPKHVWAVIEPHRFREWLFVGEKGRPFTQGNRLMIEFQAAHDAAGIPRRLKRDGRPTPYPWRMTYASILLREGVRPQKVADQLGNDLKTMLDHYAEFLPRDDDDDEIERAAK